MNEAYKAAKSEGVGLVGLRLACLIIAAAVSVITTFRMPKRKRNRYILRGAILTLLIVSIALAVAIFVIKAGYIGIKCKDAYSGSTHSACNEDLADCPGLKIVAVFTNPDVFTLPAVLSIVTAVVSATIFSFKVIFRKRLRHRSEPLADDTLDLDANTGNEISIDDVSVSLTQPVVAAAPAAVATATVAAHSGPDHDTRNRAPSMGVRSAPSGVCVIRATLPPGWEMSVAPDTNAYFYSDHNTGTTSWEPPHGARTLPPGVQEEFAPDGRPYYVNHNTQVTTWVPPM